MGWRQEGRDLLRAIAAGSIVGIPLLYTMEMWWHGMIMSPWQQLVLLGATLLINFGFCLFSGFREEYSVTEAASEAVSAVGMGMVYSLGVLALIGEVTSGKLWGDVMGKVVVETAPVSLGIAFANRQVRNRGGEDDGDAEDADGASAEDGADGDPERLQLRQDLKELAISASGAMLFAYNLAPTEEIIQISSRLSDWQHLLIVAVSLVLAYMILFAAEFRERSVHVRNWFQRPSVETVMAYAVSLLAAFVLLQLVGVPEVKGNWPVAVEASVVLGLPAAVGASAGRLIA